MIAALAAGTIIYVVVFEIMQRERSKNIKPKIVQFFAMIAGFATMMTVDLLRKLNIRASLIFCAVLCTVNGTKS